MARPCAASAAPPQSPHVREEVPQSGLLGPRGQPRAWRIGGAARKGAATVARVRVFRRPLCLYSPLGGLP